MDHKREHWTPPLARVMGVGRQQSDLHMGAFEEMMCVVCVTIRHNNIQCNNW